MKPLAHQSKIEALELVSRLSFFEGISKFDLASLAKSEQLLFFAPSHEKIMTYGEPDDKSFYLILSGTLDVYDKKNNFIRELKGGSFLGEISFITHEARTATVIVHEDTILMRITQEEMNKFPLGMKDKIKDQIIKGLADRILSLNKTCTMLYENIKTNN
ncbi:MAG: cyclic nucleotide-binding domain-containing protein [Alteromonadaceae bacterium]|nr:cyclic nucleotide-binding domain-containing protein [Alteromonadaceae bacterium]